MQYQIDAFVAAGGGCDVKSGWHGIKGKCKRAKAGDVKSARRASGAAFAASPKNVAKARAAGMARNAPGTLFKEADAIMSKPIYKDRKKSSAHPAVAKHMSGAIVPFKGKSVSPAKTKGKAKKTTHGMSRSAMRSAIAEKMGTDASGVAKSGKFMMATSGMGKLDLKKKGDLERIYRKTVGILPGEDNDSGPGVVNGINIHNYDMPWKAFGLDPKKATDQDIKGAYRRLSKEFHPDSPSGGDAKTFDRLTQMYKSITQKFY